MPRWLRNLTPIEVGPAAQVSHVLGDGDNVMLAVRTAGGDHLTALVYIDHNLGTVVKDAFVVEAPIEVVESRLVEASGGDPDTRIDEIGLADARARITEAIETGAMTYPPFETDTWPACRPFVEWVVRELPEGGTGYERPEWGDTARAELADRFFASPFGRGHDDVDRDLFQSFLWFGCDYGPGDPLRWSPVAVELLLMDWLPRKVVAEAEFLARAPDLLRSFIRYCHAERGIRQSLTEETLEAVGRWEPEYQELIRSDRPQGPAALLAAMGVLDEDDWDLGVLGPPPDVSEIMLDRLRDEVGGEEALRSLDTDPLPDEPFQWEVVAEDISDRTGDVLSLVDRCCEELLDVEHRTAARRLLADVVSADPEILRRRGRADTAAAAIVWIVGKMNGAFRSDTDLQVQDMQKWFGLRGSPSQRAATMLKALRGDDPFVYPTDTTLGTTRYLVSSTRARTIELRDRWELVED